MSALKVLFTPASPNPYLTLLSRALERQGASVAHARWRQGLGHLFPVLQQIPFHGIPEVLHVHWPEAHFLSPHEALMRWKISRFLGDVRFLRRKGAAIVWTLHNLRPHDASGGGGKNMQEEAFRRFGRLCDRFIAHNQFMKAEAARAYGLAQERITVMPLGHYIGWYENKMDRAAARRALGLDPGNLVFLYVGVISEYKGVPDLIDAFRKAALADTRLVIAGACKSAELRREITERRAGDERIRLDLRHVPDAELQVYHNAADVVVLPFRRIYTSSTLVLAMSFGRAVICPAVGGLPECVDETGGFLYDPADPSGLEKAIARAAAARENLPEMGRRNLERARLWDWDGIGRQTIEVYEAARADRAIQ